MTLAPPTPRPVPAAVPPPGPAAAATRHLCAAAYLDDDFRDRSLREVYHQPGRVVAPSYGFQLIPVLRHCLRARNAVIIRDALIVAVLTVALCATPIGVLWAASWLLWLHFGRAWWRLLRDSARTLRSADRSGAVSLLTRGSMLMVGTGIAFLAYLVGWFVLFGLTGGDQVGETEIAFSLGASVLLTLLAFALPVATSLWQQRQLDLLVPGSPPAYPARSARFDQIDSQQQGNTVVYSGYHPFVGSGPVIDSKGFAIRLVRRPDIDLPGGRTGEREREFAPFTTEEIIDHIAGELASLADDRVPERHLPGLTVTDRVFVSGTEVTRLSSHTDPAVLTEIIRNPVEPARHYLHCQVVSWRGELVTSVYVHFAVQGRSLYTEITTTALPPCDERYRVVDQVDGTGARAYLRAVWRGVVETPRTVGAAPVDLVRSVVDLVGTGIRSEVAAHVVVRRGFDYGAKVSVRELGMSDMTRNRTQTEDILKHKRIVERRVVAATLDYLEEKGVDPSEFRQRTNNILNVNAVNTGSGTQNVGGTVVGRQDNHYPSPAPVSG